MDEMRVEVGVKECSKKKLVRRKWVGHVKKWEMKNWQRKQMPRGRKWSGNGGEKTEIAMGFALNMT